MDSQDIVDIVEALLACKDILDKFPVEFCLSVDADQVSVSFEHAIEILEV